METETETIAVDEVATPARPVRPWCLFHCGADAYAIGLESVAEVVEVERLVRLPQSPPRVLGLCALRREVIPVVSLGRPGREPASQEKPGVLVLILRTARGIWAIQINAGGTVVAEESLDDDARGPGGPRLGTVRRDGASYAVIDPEVTWRDVRQGVEDWYRGPSAQDPEAGAGSVTGKGSGGPGGVHRWST
jgi:chemotaxis protein histidine kinase CheA